MTKDYSNEMGIDSDDLGGTRTELDSQANIGQHSYIIYYSGQKVNVRSFTPQYRSMEAELVDAALLYECPYEGKLHILVIWNAIHIDSMENNLIPPFILREAGLQVNERAKIHTEDPTTDDRSIIFPTTTFRIPLQLFGIFSYFFTTKPTENDMLAGHDVYVMTPERWNPHSDAYKQNKAHIMDWEGNIKQPKDRIKVIIEDLSGEANEGDYRISSLEMDAVDNICAARKQWMDEVRPMGNRTVIRPYDEVGQHLSAVSSVLVESLLALRLEERMEHGHETMVIGSTTVGESEYILDGQEDEETTDKTSLDGENSITSCDIDLDETDRMDLDEFFVPTMQIGKPRGLDAVHLSKVWRISHEDAQRMINVTSQHGQQPADPSLSQNYTTNDQMLRYHRIEDHFFMDTLFATKKGGKSSRGNTCCQLFVTDKGFLHVVPMKRKSEVYMAVKMFTKEIGAPNAIVCDMAKEQMSAKLKRFLNDIGTTLRALEEGTPWVNKAELYIKLMKEAVQIDMRESHSPLPFWGYCLERRVRVYNLTAQAYITVRGTNPHTLTLGEEGDISSLGQFVWYEWCYFCEHTTQFPHNQEVLGRVLGPARGEGNKIAQWVLKANGLVVPRLSVRPLHQSEVHSPSEQSKRQAFDTLIERRYGNSIVVPTMPAKGCETTEPYEDDGQQQFTIPDIEDSVDSTGRLINQCPAYDHIINVEVQMQLDEQVMKGTVKRCALRPDGRMMGKYDDNPYHNSIVSTRPT